MPQWNVCPVAVIVAVVAVTLTAADTTAYANSETAAPTTTSASAACAFPLTPPGKQDVVDAASEKGVWYEYLFYTPGLDEANCVTNFTYLGKVQDPRSNQISYLYNHTTTFYLLPGLVCSGVYGLVNFTQDGRRYANFFLHAVAPQLPANQSIFVPMTVFHADADWEFFYYCGNPDVANGVCLLPNLFVKTRQDPAKGLDDYLKARIKDTVNAVLKPFCMSFNDMVIFRFSSAVPLQCLTTPPPEYTAMVADAVKNWVVSV